MTRTTATLPVVDQDEPGLIRLERHYPARPERIWHLWTTPAGIESWWAPEGYRTDVTDLDLRPGGEMIYAMTAVGPDHVAFMQDIGLPLTTVSRKVFTEVVPTSRLAYRSLIDFVPDQAPYEHLTVVDLVAVGDGTHVTVTMECLHDETWTQRLTDGRANELENLACLLGA